MSIRGGTRAALILVLAAGGLLPGAPAAMAHPLGNFTVNTATELRVEPDAVAVRVVVDSAEIPTLQRFPGSAGGPVPAAEQQAYREAECAALQREVRVALDGEPAALTVMAAQVTFPPGAAGLATTRLTCDLRTLAAVDTVGHEVVLQGAAGTGRVGWHEVTAVGDGVELTATDVPAESVSDTLRAYPGDLLASPLDQRGARVSVGAGTGIVSGERDGGGRPTSVLPRGVDRLTSAFTGLVAESRLTVGFGALAFLVAMGLGALHAFAPGHGKALMAAYLVGQNGSLRQASLIGLSVTLTHTLGVLTLGTVLSVTAVAAPERIYPWLGLASGVLLVGIGVTLLRRALARRSSGGYGHDRAHPHDHDHDHPDPHDHDHGHRHAHHGHGHTHGKEHVHGSEHVHDHEHDHDHEHAHVHVEDDDPGHDHGHRDRQPALAREPASALLAPVRPLVHSHGPGTAPHSHPVATDIRGLLGVGFAGGMVPSPSALVVLLGGIALGRAWFGVVLVLAYGIGMALALVATGLLLTRLRGRIAGWAGRRHPTLRTALILRASAALPALTAALVVLVGLYLGGRALLTLA